MTDVRQGSILFTQDILRLLPHRYPFLLIDEMVDYHEDQWGIGLKNVTFNEQFFQGHFPNRPIMPGVLIIEAMAQTAGLLVQNFYKFNAHSHEVYFLSVEEARFRKPVVPGNQLIMRVEKQKQRKNIFRFKGVARVKDDIVAEAVMTAMFAANGDNSD